MSDWSSDVCSSDLGVHQRERRTADRRHRRGTVRLGDLRDDADGVRELFHRRHHGEDAALGEATVADLATLRAHHAAGFTDRIGREVVVEQEVFLVLTRDGRSEEHTSELQSLMRISYAVFCLKKKK